MVRKSRVITFDNELYSRYAISLAIEQFSEFIDGELIDEEGYKVKIFIKKGDSEEVLNELKNYILGLTKQERV